MNAYYLHIITYYFLFMPLAACGNIDVTALSYYDDSENSGDSESDSETDPVQQPVTHMSLPLHRLFDDDAPSLTDFYNFNSFGPGDGSPASCTEAKLQEAVTQINNAGEGRIELDCGDDFHRIELVTPLNIENGVRFFLHGRLDVDRKPLVALDGRGKNQIFKIGEDADVAFSKLTFVGGKSDSKNDGGGITVSNDKLSGSLIISECAFIKDYAPKDNGGAIYAARISNFSVFRSVFEGNFSSYGGALYLYETVFNIVDSSFVGNEAAETGGAIFLQSKETPPEETHILKGNIFEANSSVGGGSAVKVQQAEDIVLQVETSNFLFNSVRQDVPEQSGGALCVHGGALDLSSSTFYSNNSTMSVAGVFLNTNNGFAAQNCTFYDNNSDAGVSGAIHQEDGNVSSIQNCTFYRNQGTRAGALYREDTTGLKIVSTIFVDDILDDADAQSAVSCNASFVDDTTDGNSNFEYRDSDSINFPKCTGNAREEKLSLTLSESSSDSDESFVKTFALPADSPAIAAGANCAAVDARGVVRVNAPEHCDAGAYERGSVAGNDTGNADTDTSP